MSYVSGPPGFYLPWGLLALNMLMGADIMSDLAGIAVGHLYYYLTVLHPRNTGARPAPREGPPV